MPGGDLIFALESKIKKHEKRILKLEKDLANAVSSVEKLMSELKRLGRAL